MAFANSHNFSASTVFDAVANFSNCSSGISGLLRRVVREGSPFRATTRRLQKEPHLRFFL